MRKITAISGVIGLFLALGGGIVFAIQYEMTLTAGAFLWVGLLMLLFSLYVNFNDIRDLLARRSTKYGVNMLIMILVFGGVVVFMAFISNKNSRQWDLTKSGRYTLSGQTIKILKNLKSEVRAVAFYRGGGDRFHIRQRQTAEDLLANYSNYSPLFKYEFIDPDRNPGLAVKYGVSEYRIILLLHKGREVKIARETEEKFTNALLKVTRESVKTVYFLKGHGENDIASARTLGYKATRNALNKEGYLVKELMLIAEERVPADAALLIVSSPKRDLREEETQRIAAYLRNGGKLLFMLDPGYPLGLKRFLSHYGFTVGDDMIVDKQSQVYGANFLTPIIYVFDKMHPLTKDFNVAAYFPWASSVQVENNPRQGRYNLAFTGPKSWAETDLKMLEQGKAEFDDKTEKSGPIPVMAVSVIKAAGSEKPREGETTRQKYGKVIVVGDSDFANNTNINVGGNGDLFLNTVNWLAEEADLISIRKKGADMTPVALTVKQGRIIFWVPTVVIPSFVLFAMMAHYVRRRMGR